MQDKIDYLSVLHSRTVRAGDTEGAAKLAAIIETLEVAPESPVNDIVTAALTAFCVRLEAVEPGMRIGSGHPNDRIRAELAAFVEENGL